MKLSICIPTYNRSEELDRLLNMIYNERYLNDLEIVISDNDSSDLTEDIVKIWQKKIENLVYLKNKKNIGFDKNLNNAIKNASGEYIWILGDDDGITEGSIKLLSENVRGNEDILVLNGFFCDKDLKILKERNGLNLKENKNFVIDKFEDLKEYISLIDKDISFLFAFISGIVVKREKWMENYRELPYEKTGYDHVLVLLKILNNRGILKYLVDKYYLAGESANEYSIEYGKHFLLDLSCYKLFFKEFTNDKKLREEINRIFYDSANIIKFLDLINYATKKNKKRELKEALQYFYLDNTLKYKITKILYILRMNYYIDFLRKFKNKMKRR